MPQTLHERRTTLTRSSAGAMKTVVSVFGVVIALAGVEHGIGEILQGPARPDGLVIESWPGAGTFEVLAGEPAMTIVPNLLITGLLAVVTAGALGLWAVRAVDDRRGGLVLVLLSVLLLLVGGGFGPPLMGVLLGLGAAAVAAVPARRARTLEVLGRGWRWMLAIGVSGFLGLLPGTVILSEGFEVRSDGLVYALGAVAFGGLVLALLTAAAQDRCHATTSG